MTFHGSLSGFGSFVFVLLFSVFLCICFHVRCCSLMICLLVVSVTSCLMYWRFNNRVQQTFGTGGFSFVKAEYVSELKYLGSRIFFRIAHFFSSKEHPLDIVELHHVLDGMHGPDFHCASLIRHLRNVVLVDQVGMSSFFPSNSS